MAPSSSDSTDLSALFDDFTTPVDLIAPNILRNMYDELDATCGQPDKLRTIVQELVQTRLQLDMSTTALDNESYKNAELKELEERLLERTKSMLDAKAALALQEEKAKHLNQQLQRLEKDMKGVERLYTEQAKAMQALKNKRKADENTNSSDSRPNFVKKAKLAPASRTIACSQCYTKSWECDGASHCRNCIERVIPAEGCKRIKCQFFELGTCKKRQCTLAHEEEGYRFVVPFIKLRQKNVGPPPSGDVKKDGGEKE
ncbi:Nn.00g000260.m01.CDS01 [Neocucurbitaria sp. VM-36]